MSYLRSLKREMAKQNMKKKGMKRFCSNPSMYNPITKKWGRVGSTFSRVWRGYVK